MSAIRYVTTVGMLLNLCVFVTAGAATDPRSCARIDDDAARLACYDAAFRRPGTATARAPAAAATSAGAAAAAATVPPNAPTPAAASPVATGAVSSAVPTPTPSATAAPTAAASPSDEFGLSEQEKRARGPVDEPREPDSIAGRIAKVGARPTGELILTFDDGQVWTQVQPEHQIRLKAGDDVVIRKASLGSYLLVTPSKISTRVRRVK